MDERLRAIMNSDPNGGPALRIKSLDPDAKESLTNPRMRPDELDSDFQESLIEFAGDFIAARCGGVFLPQFQKDILRNVLSNQYTSIMIPPEFGGTTLLEAITRWHAKMMGNDLGVVWVGKTDEVAITAGRRLHLLGKPDCVFIGPYESRGGTRADLVILDDPQHRTGVEERDRESGSRFVEWMNQELLHCMAPGARVIQITHNHHSFDYHHRKESDIRWSSYRYPIRNGMLVPWIDWVERSKEIPLRDQLRLLNLLDDEVINFAKMA